MEAYYAGKLIADNKESDLFDEEIVNWQNINQYWPDTWSLSDHGNIHHYHLNGVEYQCRDNNDLCPDGVDVGNIASQDIIIQS